MNYRLPLPEGALKEQTDTHTYQAGDGFWYEPSNLEAYFKESFWGINFVDAASAAMNAGYQNRINNITNDIYGTD